MRKQRSQQRRKNNEKDNTKLFIRIWNQTSYTSFNFALLPCIHSIWNIYKFMEYRVYNKDIGTSHIGLHCCDISHQNITPTGIRTARYNNAAYPVIYESLSWKTDKAKRPASGGRVAHPWRATCQPNENKGEWYACAPEKEQSCHSSQSWGAASARKPAFCPAL